MKKSILKFTYFFAGFAFVAIIFSSCLGNSDSSFETGKDFAYITTTDDNIVTYAATAHNGITNEQIRNLKRDECYFLGYKISTKMGFYHHIQIAQLNSLMGPLPQSLLTSSPVPTNINNEVFPTDFSIQEHASTSYFGDRWLISYNTEIRENDSTEVKFYYDKNNQVDADGKTVTIDTDHKVIIDVRFDKAKVDPDTSKPVNPITIDGVGNLGSLRNQDSGLSNNHLLIQFRYKQYIKDGKPIDAFVGSWNGALQYYIEADK